MATVALYTHGHRRGPQLTVTTLEALLRRRTALGGNDPVAADDAVVVGPGGAAAEDTLVIRAPADGALCAWWNAANACAWPVREAGDTPAPRLGFLTFAYDGASHTVACWYHTNEAVPRLFRFRTDAEVQALLVLQQNATANGSVTLLRGPRTVRRLRAGNNLRLVRGADTVTLTLAFETAVPLNGLTNATLTATSLQLGAMTMVAGSGDVLVGARQGDEGGTSLGRNVLVGAETTVGQRNLYGNVCVGYGTIRDGNPADSTPSYNTVVGYQCGATIGGGSYNTACGAGAGKVADLASNSTAIGAGALPGYCTADRNTCVGYYAGRFLQYGGNNVVLGGWTAQNQSALSRAIVIGDGDGELRAMWSATGTLSLSTAAALPDDRVGRDEWGAYQVRSERRLHFTFRDDRDDVHRVSVSKERSLLRLTVPTTELALGEAHRNHYVEVQPDSALQTLRVGPYPGLMPGAEHEFANFLSTSIVVAATATPTTPPTQLVCYGNYRTLPPNGAMIVKHLGDNRFVLFGCLR